MHIMLGSKLFLRYKIIKEYILNAKPGVSYFFISYFAIEISHAAIVYCFVRLTYLGRFLYFI